MIKLAQATMTVEEWFEVSDNPIQRNTELHAKKARNKHLKAASPTHARVSAAQLPSGEVYKLDGHTRSLLWKEQSLDAPKILYVDVYHVDNLQQVEDLYKQFDNPTAGEVASDKLHGAFRLHGFQPKSTLVVHGGVTSAIQLLENDNGRSSSPFNIYTQVTPWVSALREIDGCQFSNGQFVSGLMAAMLLSTQIYGPSALDFWKAYANDEGTKAKGIKCPVQALTDLINEKRNKKQLGGRYQMQEIASKAISCFEMWRSGGSYTTGVKQTDLRAYMQKKLKADPALKAG